MKYVLSPEEIEEVCLDYWIDADNEIRTDVINNFLKSKTPVEEIAVISLLLKEDKSFQLNISTENYVKDCNYYKIYVNHFIQEVTK